MIVFENVDKSWDGGHTFAVKKLNLKVERSTVLALLGGSGSGKSTTVKMINRLIEPTDGRITIDGKCVTEQDVIQLRRSIGYVFQGVGLFPHMSVGDNVAIGMRLADIPEKDRKARVEELMEMVSLPASEYAHRYPSQLSGGQRQRIGFARALATKPRLMLLDEPFGALDPVTRDSLQAEFMRFQKELDLTAVIVTHDMAEALLLADHIAVMKDGELLRYGTPKELLAEPGHEYVATLLETPKKQSELLQRIQSHN